MNAAHTIATVLAAFTQVSFPLVYVYLAPAVVAAALASAGDDAAAMAAARPGATRT